MFYNVFKVLNLCEIVSQVSGKVNAKSNGHDYSDHTDKIETNTPKGHKSEYSNVDRDDRERNPKTGDRFWNEHQRDTDDGDSSISDGRESTGKDGVVLFGKLKIL